MWAYSRQQLALGDRWFVAHEISVKDWSGMCDWSEAPYKMQFLHKKKRDRPLKVLPRTVEMSMSATIEMWAYTVEETGARSETACMTGCLLVRHSSRTRRVDVP
jgi:hypothetical protein